MENGHQQNENARHTPLPPSAVLCPRCHARARNPPFPPREPADCRPGPPGMNKMARRRAPALALAVLVLLLCAAVDPDSVAAADSAASDDESLDYDDPLHIHAQHARQAVGGGRSGGGSSSAADLLKLGDLPDGYHYPGASSHRDRDLHQDPQRERVYERLRASEGLYCAGGCGRTALFALLLPKLTAVLNPQPPVCHAVARHLASEVRPHVLDGVPLTLEQAEQYAAAACGPPQCVVGAKRRGPILQPLADCEPPFPLQERADTTDGSRRKPRTAYLASFCP